MEGVPAAYSELDGDGDSGVSAAATPVVLGGGRVVGRVRQLEGRLGIKSVVLGDDGGGRGDVDCSLVSCSSGERRSSSGATASAVPGR